MDWTKGKGRVEAKFGAEATTTLLPSGIKKKKKKKKKW
jgi:hypothetical protein